MGRGRLADDMSTPQLLIAALAAIVLFQYALRGFSRELQEVGGARLRRELGRITANRWSSFGVGAVGTALVQSSSAVTALAVTLVDTGALTFRASLGVLLGANVGTTSTAWLVAFKLTGIGPLFIVLGAVASALPVRARVLGQGLFYFGLIFFTLDLISGTLAPLREHPEVMHWLARAADPSTGTLFGLVFTAVVQSSSVTTGLAILFVQQGLLPPAAAIPIVIGSNIGTTSTALIASARMSSAARAVAVANLMFNAAGVLAVLPVLRVFAEAMVRVTGGAEQAVVWAHLVFNLAVGGLFLVALDRVAPLLERWLGVDRPVSPTGR